MKNLWLGSLLFVLAGGCSSPYRDLQPAESNLNFRSTVSPFQSLNQTLLFKARITRNELYYSGLMLVKQTDNNTFRIVLTTELGPKLFDFELTPQKFIVHQCLDAMNRKIVLNMIEQDLRLVLIPLISNEKIKAFSDPASGNIVYKVKAKKGLNYCYLESKSGNLIRVENASLLGRKKIQVDFENYKKELPGIINITHPGINLNLQFELAER